jgi:N-acetylglucosamine-6-phosphate deacetylase
MMILSPRSLPVVVCLIHWFCVAMADGAVPQTAPPPGLRENTPAVHALVGAKIVVAPGKVIENGNLIIRDGIITAVGAEATVPSHARVWNMKGRTLYAAFIDSSATLPDSASATGEAGHYWNDQITPEVRAEQIYRADKKANEKLRSQGIAVRLVHPASSIIHGTSALVTTRDADSTETLLGERVALHMKLSTPRKPHDDHYPTSPMGAMTLVRQAWYDARWYRDASAMYRQKPALPRPERNLALEALLPYLDGKRPVVVEAPDNLYFLRADQVGKEFGLNVIVRGSGDEYQWLDAIKAAGRPVILPLNFPKAPDVAVPEKASRVSLARLMHWDMAPENPARLVKAGVKIVFTTEGLKEVDSFLAALRKAVARGLSADDALRALTIAPAELWGFQQRLGTLEVGKSAHVLVADGDLFVKKTKLLETWIDGQRYETAPAPLADLRGTWEFKLSRPDGGSETIVIKLGGEPNELSGTIHRGAKEAKLANVVLDGAQWSATFKAAPVDWSGVVQLSATLLPKAEQSGAEAATADPTLSGSATWSDGKVSRLEARRTAAYDPREADKKPAAKDAQPGKEAAPEKPADKKDGEKNVDDKKATDKKDDETKEADKPPQPALFPVNYPFGDFGRSAIPEQPKVVFFKHATVWTCGPQGVLNDASVLVESGKIKAVGVKIDVPKDAVVIDAKGQHITPGIIDCHSHIATDGGVNETGQTITAEVRIGDFIDSQDINIYRQLAGGVTTSNILHGSANTIGGQNQVIKFRWGLLPAELKFASAPPGVKFALGENVKQSNWGDHFRTRFPQTRMGVEQLVRDAFQAAIEYRRTWVDWRRNKTGLPPRFDLELEALSEVLAGQRLIHCHAYRQDEILSLLRTCDAFGVRIATFQHILEGYKVADVMAKHGVGGSSFSDWWAFKFEVYDAIPYNGALLRDAGVLVSFNSDDAELGRRLNLEAAKAMKYGGVPEVEALKFVTLNPAKQLGIDKRVGSLEVGKDADLVIWNRSPLSTYTRCEQTWVDGRPYFTRDDDAKLRKEMAEHRTKLIQRVLTSGDPTEDPDDIKKDIWPREDIFCFHGDEE